jgi:transcription antitermination factor NusG
MPLLRLERDFLPPRLFELSEICMPWWVAHVRSRREKALARHLSSLDIPFYLPLHEKRSQRGGRQFRSHLPLFAGYVFCRGRGKEKLAALQTKLVCRILEVACQQALSAELAQLRRLQEAGARLEPQRVFETGDPVRVTQGPFTGYSGVVVRGGGRPRLVVSISMLRKSVAVELDRASIVSVPGSARPSGGTRRVASA